MKIKKIIASVLTFMMLFMNVPTNVFAETKGEAIPLDITLVLDVSGSMRITLNDGKTRMDVLKDFVYNLIDEFSSKNANITDVNKQNRISIVKFAGDKSDNVGNETDGYGDNYTQVVSDYIAVQDTNKDGLKTEVKGIYASGSTNALAAMELTKDLVNSSVNDTNRKNAKRVVVFVTDGLPYIYGMSYADAANKTISIANSIKKNAYIYSVGLSTDTDSTIEGDNGDGNWTTKEMLNAYLHAVSSNYPDATAYDKLGERLNGADYYKGVKSSSETAGAFNEITRLLSDMLFDLADYTKVNEAKAKVPSNLSLYTEETVKTLKDALNAVEEGKNITEQTTVDGYAEAINKAINNLVLKDADYTKVKEAKTKVPSDLSVYTEETVKALKDALALVEEGKNITEQAKVDGYADAINKAISELKYKDADYTKVNEAKAKVPSDLSIYTDETVKTLKDALALVEEGKNITEQATVDGYANAINKAIEGLVKKNKDYKVIEGEGGTFVKESGKDISIRIDHDFTENVKVEVDDREVDKAHYKVTKGSTIITFDDMYLNTLAVGTHQVKVTFEDGVATTTLVIKEQTKDDKSETPGKDNNEKKDSTSNNQETVKSTVKTENKEDVKKVKTGDDENIIGVALLLIGSLVVLTYLRKKKIE